MITVHISLKVATVPTGRYLKVPSNEIIMVKMWINWIDLDQ